MQKIIDRIIYDTNTAKPIYSKHFTRRDNVHAERILYRTEKGRYFTVTSCEDFDDVEPYSEDEAYEYLAGEGREDLLLEHFGHLLESA